MTDEKVDPAVTAKREQLAKLREERLAREAERKKQDALLELELGLANEEAVAAAESKYGAVGKAIALVYTRLGVVIVKAPNHMLVRKFRDSGTPTSNSWEELIKPCLVHPSEEAFDRILEEQNGMLVPVAFAVLGLAGINVEEMTGKS